MPEAAPSPAPEPMPFEVAKGGNALPGKPIEAQNPGNAATNPEVPVTKKPVAPAPPPPDPPREDPKPVKPLPVPDGDGLPRKITPSIPPPVVPVTPREPPKPVDPPAPKVEPRPKEPPRPKGPTRDAEPSDTTQPTIPEALRKSEFRSFVRVKVEVEADGSFTPILRTSSGNPEIDRRVLEALKRWRWKPALRDGEAVKSTQLFKFEFEVK